MRNLWSVFLIVLRKDIKEMEKSNIMIRLEKKEEYQKVENLVRESFWDVYRPGCLEQIGRFGCFFVMFICYK